MSNKLDLDYQQLLQDILDNGVKKEDRTGTGTLSVFGRQIKHKMSDGKFPLLTTKKMPFKTIVTELLWFLNGDTNIKYLVDNGCNIWNGDAFQNFLNKSEGDPDIIWNQEQFISEIKENDEFAKKWGELGPIYGKQWRNWDGDNFISGNFRNGIDQIQNLINDLKTNPDSRRLMVSAWSVHNLPNMVLPPCHYGFQMYTRELSEDERRMEWCKRLGKDISYANKIWNKELDLFNFPTRKISLMFNMRSNDVPLGLPFNIASYGLLLEIISRMVNMIPDELIANLGDAHVYKNQIDGIKEQLTRTPMKLPNLIISDDVNFNGTIDEFLESCNKDSFKLNEYESHSSIKMPLSN